MLTNSFRLNHNSQGIPLLPNRMISIFVFPDFSFFLLYYSFVGFVIQIIAMESYKRIAVEGGTPDRISNLPIKVIDHILACVPIREAARTSVLSRKWRYMFNQHTQLVFNKQFCQEIMQKTSSTEFQDSYEFTVSGILLQKLGLILNFALEVPKLPSTKYSTIDDWLFFISRKGLQQLTLDNSNPIPYKIPSYIFSCPSLFDLNISNCIFKAPTTFQGFTVLTYLRLDHVSCESSVLSIPTLVSLSIIKCVGVCNFDISAPQLIKLALFGNDDLELSYYMNCTSLRRVFIALSRGVEYHRQNKRISFAKLLSFWPLLTHLYLDGDFIKYLATGNTVPERLPTEMNFLKCLVPMRVTYDLDQIACILCLLRSSINLFELEIRADQIIHSGVKVVEYLEGSGLVQQILRELQMVRMINFQGSAAELLFVKLLLAISPSIERICIVMNQNLDLNVRTQISEVLTQLSEASPKAKIIIQPRGIV